MKNRILQMKRMKQAILLVVLLSVSGMTICFAADYDFSAVCSSGQTLYYRITNNDSHEVQLTYPNYYSYVIEFGMSAFRHYNYWYNYDQPVGDVIIPSHVQHNGETWSVTSIRDHTFGDPRENTGGQYGIYYHPCTQITSIVIPSTVTSIGNSAFAKCSGLSSVTLPNSISSIENNAFCKCTGLNLIVSLAETPPVLGTNTFYDVDKSITVNVPCASIESYQSAQGWSEFTNYIATGPIELEVTETACDNYIWNETSYNISGDFIQQFSTSHGCDSVVTLHLTIIESVHNVEYADECESYEWHGETYTSSGTYIYEYINENGCQSADTLYLTINNIQENFITSTHVYVQKIVLPNEEDSIVQVWWNRDEFATCEYNHYLVYRTNCDNNGPYNDDNITLLSTVYSSDTSYYDTQLLQVEPGLYKYGISAVYDSITTEIVWSDLNSPCVASNVEIIATANMESGGTVIGYGEYNYGTMITLTAVANEGYTFVNWTENGEIVSTEPVYSFTVTENRSLVANFSPLMNHWTAESYSNSMFMIGFVTIDGVDQASPTLELGAFCNGECRGSEISFEEDGRWLYFMAIGGNDGDEIMFRPYDHALQQELDLYCYNVLPFDGSAFIGLDIPYEVRFAGSVTISAEVNPVEGGTVTGVGEYTPGTSATLVAIPNEGYAFNCWTLDGEAVSTEPSYTFTVTESMNFTAHFDVLQLQQLTAGWNWFSTYLEITKEDLQNALVAALSNPTGAIIKSQDGNSTYRGGRWRDQNFEWDVAKMYRIMVPEDCVISLTGMPINPAEHPITIAPNTPTWFGFPFDESMTPAEAIPAGFAVNGDMIKGINGNIGYYGGRWRSQGMNSLEPGQGYIYNSASAVSRTLIFPTSAK